MLLNTESSQAANRGDQPPRILRFAPKRIERFNLAGSARLHVEDGAGWYAGTQHLPAVCLRQVNMPFAGSAKGAAARRQGGKELVSRFGGALDTATVLRVFLKSWDPLRECRPETFGHFFAHFVATFAYTRPDRGVYIRWLSPKISVHFAQRGADNFLRRTAPAGMHRGNRAQAGIEQEDRHTVSGPNANAQVQLVGDQSIALALEIAKAIRVENQI
jgi:hypothetical protein